MTAYSHREIKLSQTTSKTPQRNWLLTNFSNYGYHTVLRGLACVKLSGAVSVLVLYPL